MFFLFYISNHGFGHLNRNLDVVKRILSCNIRLVIVSGKSQLKFLKLFLSSEEIERCIFLERNLDFGLVVKENELVIDQKGLKIGIKGYVDNFQAMINDGKKIIRLYDIKHVISDVTPWILSAAKKLNVRSTLLASFTWLDIYEEFLPNELLKPFVECYADAQQVILYDLANPKTIQRFSKGIKVGLSARSISPERVIEIKSFLSSVKKTVFVSVGMSNNGIASSYDVSNLPYNFITTHGVRLIGTNVFHLPIDVMDTQNYIAASDYCISKAGWTTIAEILLAKKPMALIKRDDNAEDRYLINELSRRHEAIGIELTELSDIEKILNKMKATDWGDYEYYNDSKKIAKLIMNY